jgi:cellulose biosynthesis protein BcsQ
MDEMSAAAPGVIVVAERSIRDLLVGSGASWVVQERQPSIAAMWDALSGGRLDQRSRVLVFSDSLALGTSGDDTELVQTARAIVAMANAGAHVFVATWRPDESTGLGVLIDEESRARGVDPATLVYHRLPVNAGGRAVLEAMRSVLQLEVAFPADVPDVVDGPLAHLEADIPGPAGHEPAPEDQNHFGHDFAEPELPDTELAPVAEAPSDETAPAAPAHEPVVTVAEPAPISLVRGAPGMPGRPSMPPVGGASEPTSSAHGSEYPASASLELLERPKRPGQTTITVTSSKGGSGKSTASILLAGSIARATADAGQPLSVCLIDLDTRDGQVASLIGKFMPTALNIRVQPVWDEERIRRNLVHADGLGIDTLLAPIRPRTADTVGPDFYRTIVRSLQRMYDVVIMDTSVQYLEPLIAEVALGEADEILFVTTLASTAVQGMARALREITAPIDESGLGIPREKIGIIVNQSVANVGMERDQVLAAGLGVPVVGVIPLATKDVLTATNLNRMYALLDHPLLGPAYNELARACLPGRELGPWQSTDAAAHAPAIGVPVPSSSALTDGDEAGRKRGLFRR